MSAYPMGYDDWTVWRSETDEDADVSVSAWEDWLTDAAAEAQARREGYES